MEPTFCIENIQYSPDSEGGAYSKAPLQHVHTGVLQRQPKKRHIGVMAKLIIHFKARIKYAELRKSLKEVQLIESGKKKPKSLDDLLNEL